MGLVLLPFKALWYALVIALPLLGFWLASTLTVFLNGPQWLPWLAGALSLLLPMLWEVESQFRFSRKVAASQPKASEGQPQAEKPAPKRILKTGDRLILRVMALNLLFLLVLLIAFPQKSFAALATRGDWMLENQKAPWAENARQTLFQAADKLEVLYESTRNNPYVKFQPTDEPETVETPVPGEVQPSEGLSEENLEPELTDESPAPSAPPPSTQPSTEPSASSTPTPKAVAPKAVTPKAAAAPAWPMSASLHPAIAKMPAAAETSIASVANYIAQQEQNPHQRVKAIYDWLASRIEYDAGALMTGLFPDQDAESVFTARKGVCAGYANLFKALADKIGLESAYVVGDARTLDGQIAGSSHAWNAVEVGGKWYLLDATWGAGYVENYKFTREYNPAYLLTPPEVFAMDHLPDEDKWQLRQPPLDRGEFSRQPMLRASFFERGWKLLEPTRSQVSVGKQAALKLKNARRQYLMARLVPAGGGTAAPCSVAGMADVSVTCPIPSPGSYQVMLFANTSPSGSFEYIGQLSVVSG